MSTNLNPRAQCDFAAFFLKICILGILWPKFLLKNSFFKCLNKVCWCASKTCTPGRMPHYPPLLRHWVWSLWNSKTHCNHRCNECVVSVDCRLRFYFYFFFLLITILKANGLVSLGGGEANYFSEWLSPPGPGLATALGIW